MTSIHRTTRLVRLGDAHRLTLGSVVGQPEDALPGRQITA